MAADKEQKRPIGRPPIKLYEDLESTLGELPDRQLRVYKFVRERIEKRGLPPTLTEISKHMGCSYGAASGLMRSLARRGLIERGARPMARQMKVLGARPRSERVRRLLAGEPAVYERGGRVILDFGNAHRHQFDMEVAERVGLRLLELLQQREQSNE